MAQNFKLKVLTLITKLSDRDTYNLAVAELDSIAGNLDNTTLSTFISCILSTDSTDKSLIRKQCLHLLSTLSHLYSNSLSSFLPRILSYVARRIRDHDSSIRSHCVATVSSLASKITKQPFSTAFLKPLSESVFTEQDLNAQIGSALCLAAAIDATPDPEPGRLGRMLVPKLERLLKSESYRAKSAGLVVVGSVIGVGGVKGYAGMGGLVKSLVGFLSSEDWAARKAAAEALGRLAVVERDAVAEFKSGCLKIFENRKFDKVKAAREVMHQMIESWKQVPDVSEDVSPPPRSLASSKEDASDGRYPTGSRNSHAAGSEASEIRRRTGLASRSTPPDNSAATVGRRRGSLRSAEKKTGPALFRKADCMKPLDWKVEIAVPSIASSTGIADNDNAVDRRLTKTEAKRAVSSKNADDKAVKIGGFKSGSRVVPCHDESPVSTVVASNIAENHHSNHKECEDLSLIRNQLVQIERQQSSLLDLLQFILNKASSQTFCALTF
ncbi:TORTIFOLIA1-like protein 3 isoform X2 [Jatropha curcas]|uniref:TORTIFOLIA1-like protein 3 isoform X2 n=1 Tax=Jatropha curcas TaxID=180498 RepID=UPI001895DB53|nr:TORTIFOLIA1-like protein 3 isoform X2 [Jatropha curcas]